MAIPDFQTIMLPLLEQFEDGKEHSIHEVLENLAKRFKLSEQELNEMLPSGKQTSFYNRVGWARTYLSKSGLLEMTRRSIYQITDRGRDVLKIKPTQINMKFLEKFPEYVEFRERERIRSKSQDRSALTIEEKTEHKTPEEILDDAYQAIRDNLAQELLGLVKQCGGPKKLDRKTGSLRGYPAPVEPPARRLQTRPVSGIPTMNGCVYDYTHPR